MPYSQRSNDSGLMSRYSRQRKELLAGRRDLPGMGGSMRTDQSAASEASNNVFEQQNNAQLDALHGQIRVLKNLSIGIGDEVRDQNNFLSNMNRDMEGARNLMSSTLGKVSEMIASGGSQHLCLLTGFIVFVFILIYFFVYKV